MSTESPVHKQDPFPDIVATILLSGSIEARIRHDNDVIATATDLRSLFRLLLENYPEGFSLQVQYDHGQ